MPCSDGIAPRQTSIPVWLRHYDEEEDDDDDDDDDDEDEEE